MIHGRNQLLLGGVERLIDQRLDQRPLKGGKCCVIRGEIEECQRHLPHGVAFDTGAKIKNAHQDRAVAKLLDHQVHPRSGRGAHVGASVDHPRDGVDRDPGAFGNVVNGHSHPVENLTGIVTERYSSRP